MEIKIIELGPFGSRIPKGMVNKLEDLPKGYRVWKIETEPKQKIVFIEPTTEKSK